MAVDVVFVKDDDGWYREFQSWEGIVGQHMKKITVATTHLARIEAPHPGGPPHGRTGINYSTGELASGIVANYTHTRSGPTGNLESHVIAIPEHALIVHQGSVPHVIVPRRPGGLLRFFWTKLGVFYTGKKVNHPGTQADPFLWRALEKAIARWG